MPVRPRGLPRASRWHAPCTVIWAEVCTHARGPGWCCLPPRSHPPDGVREGVSAGRATSTDAAYLPRVGLAWLAAAVLNRQTDRRSPAWGVPALRRRADRDAHRHPDSRGSAGIASPLPAVFGFLFDVTLDATNWRAEQALRPAVVNRKVSVRLPVGGDALEAADGHRRAVDARAGTRARTAGRTCARGCRGRRWSRGSAGTPCRTGPAR